MADTSAVPWWLPYAVSAITGGLAGQILNWLLTRHRDRRDLTITIVREFLARFNEMAAVLGLLGARRPVAASELNRILLLGDWMDTVLFLVNEGYADGALLTRIGLVAQTARFARAAASAVDVLPELRGPLQHWKRLSC